MVCKRKKKTQSKALKLCFALTSSKLKPDADLEATAN